MSVKSRVSRLKRLIKIDVFEFIKYNFFCRKVKRDSGCYLIPYRGAVIEMQNGSVLELHANLAVNAEKLRGSKAEAYLLLREGARLTIDGDVLLTHHSVIEVHRHAKMSLGRYYINIGAVLIAGHEMRIGDGVLISRNVYIYDADHHRLYDSEGKQTNPPCPLSVGNHVWIGIKATLLRGTRVEDGAVIAAGSVVMGKVKGGTMAMGYPARSYSEVRWEE